MAELFIYEQGPALEENITITPDYGAIVQAIYGASSSEELLRQVDGDGSRLRKLAHGVLVQVAQVAVLPNLEADEKSNDDFIFNDAAFEEAFPQGSLLRLAQVVRMSRHDIADICEVTFESVGRMVGHKKPEPQAVGPRGGHSTAIKLYGFRDVLHMVHKIEQTPIADETDLALTDLSNTLGTFVYGYAKTHPEILKPRDKRRNPVHGIKGYCLHVTAAEAAILHDPPDIAVATDRHIGISKIAERAGVSLPVAIRKVELLCQQEPGLIVPLRPSPGRRARDYLPRPIGERLIEEIRPQPLTPDKVTLRFLARYFGKNKSVITSRLAVLSHREERAGRGSAAEYMGELMNLGGHESEVLCYPWKALEVLEDEWGMRAEGMDPIDRARLARGPDADVAAQLYSQQIQRRFIKPEKLAKIFVDYEAVRARMGCDEYAFSVLLRRVKVSKDQMLLSQDGTLPIGLSQFAIKDIEAYPIGSPAPGFTRLHIIARSAAGLTLANKMAQAYEALNTIEAQFPGGFGEQECRLGRVDASVGLYYAPHITKRAISIIKTTVLQGVTPGMIRSLTGMKLT
jgi:hypothetical protein